MEPSFDINVLPDPPPFEEVTNAGLVPRFVKFLDQTDLPSLQIEAVAILSLYVTTADNVHINYVVTCGAIPGLTNLISASNPQFHGRVLRTLCGILRNSQQYREIVLRDQSLERLVLELNAGHLDHVLSLAVEALYLMCTGDSPLNYQRSSRVFQVLPQLLDLLSTEDVIQKACQILDRLSANAVGVPEDGDLVDSCTLLVELLNHKSPAVVLRALQTISNMISVGFERSILQGIDDGLAEDEYYCTELIDSISKPNGLQRIRKLLLSEFSHDIKAATCQVTERLTIGHPQGTQDIINAHILNAMHELYRSAEDLRYHVGKVFVSAVQFGSARDLGREMISLVEPLCQLTDHPDVGMDCLRSLQTLVRNSIGESIDGESALPGMIDYCDEDGKIKKLCQDENPELRELLVRMMFGFGNRFSGPNSEFVQFPSLPFSSNKCALTSFIGYLWMIT